MPNKLSYEDFLRSFEFAPRFAVELLVENLAGGLLLLKRDSEPFVGYWHLPGGFLLKNESIRDCILRLAIDELNTQIDADKIKKTDLFETLHGDPRGHVLHYPVKLNIDNCVNGNYFKVIPKQTIPYQVEFMRKLGYKIEN